jgi:hypothetical protein
MFALGIAVAIFAGMRAADDRDVWSEVSRAGVTLSLITVAGAVASVAVKRVDERRAREIELRRILHAVLGAYNEVKAARRNLKALGVSAREAPHRLHDDQVAELRTVFAQLNKAQLELEANKREIPHSGLFHNPGAATSNLRRAEKFINDEAIETWEKVGGQLWPGKEVTLSGLSAFFKGFEDHVSTPLDRFLEQVNDEIRGRSTSSPTTTDRVTGPEPR